MNSVSSPHPTVPSMGVRPLDVTVPLTCAALCWTTPRRGYTATLKTRSLLGPFSIFWCLPLIANNVFASLSLLMHVCRCEWCAQCVSVCVRHVGWSTSLGLTLLSPTPHPLYSLP